MGGFAVVAAPLVATVINLLFLLFLLVVDCPAIVHYIGERVKVFDSCSDDYAIGTLSDWADNLVVVSNLKVCAVDYYATTTLLQLGHFCERR